MGSEEGWRESRRWRVGVPEEVPRPIAGLFRHHYQCQGERERFGITAVDQELWAPVRLIGVPTSGQDDPRSALI